MEQFVLLIVAGLFGAAASPTVTRLDLNAGANSSRFATEDPSMGVTQASRRHPPGVSVSVSPMRAEATKTVPASTRPTSA